MLQARYHSFYFKNWARSWILICILTNDGRSRWQRNVFGIPVGNALRERAPVKGIKCGAASPRFSIHSGKRRTKALLLIPRRFALNIGKEGKTP